MTHKARPLRRAAHLGLLDGFGLLFESLSDSVEELAERLQGLLVLLGQQAPNALMHDLPRQHLALVEFTDELER